jgi:cytochrome c553
MISKNLCFRLAVLVGGLFLSGAAPAADATTGERLFPHCATCHGARGEGGKGGEYPRIAGLPSAYIEKQLNAFKTRQRLNKPMLPIFKDWRFNKPVMAAVADYVSRLPEMPIDTPAYRVSADVLASFDSRQEFEELGAELFIGTCAQCHGDDGRGRADKASPPLVNQYPAYIKRQIADFASGRRAHEHAEKMFGELDKEEVESLLLYLSQQASL